MKSGALKRSLHLASYTTRNHKDSNSTPNPKDLSHLISHITNAGISLPSSSFARIFDVQDHFEEYEWWAWGTEMECILSPKYIS